VYLITMKSCDESIIATRVRHDCNARLVINEVFLGGGEEEAV